MEILTDSTAELGTAVALIGVIRDTVGTGQVHN